MEFTLKILHITTCRVLYKGQRKQLEYEVDSAQEMQLTWDTVALHTEVPQNDFERQIPKIFRNRVMLRIYGWLFAIRHSRNYDLILFRDLQLDPFGPLLGLFVRNRITVHHAKEIEELSVLREGGIFSQIGVWLEKYIKPLTMRSATGLIGVTNEIKEYEIERFPHLKDRAYLMPNGYNFRPLHLNNGFPSEQELNVVFVCAEFSNWHGLDRLLRALNASGPLDRKIKFHLVGSLTEEQLREVANATTPQIEILCHGLLDKDDLSSLYSLSHLAIGSLALDRKGLAEAATLKTREYLAAGLPVYATHTDTALPPDFPYFFNDSEGVSIERLLEYWEGLKGHEKDEIRNASVVYLDKASIMRKLVADLSGIRPA